MIRYRTILLLLALTASLSFLAVWHSASQGSPGPRSPDALIAPLDDAAIYFQYARQALQGEWLHYSPGSGLSTGATSLLYLALLSLLMGLGLSGPLAAWLLGLATFLLALISLDRLGRRLFPALPPWWHGALLLTQGSWAAATFNGMETGLFLALSLAALDALSDETRSPLPWLLALSFTRPEGQWFCAMLGLGWAWASPHRNRRLFTIALLAAAPTALLWGLSGDPIPDSVRPKSLALRQGKTLWSLAADASNYAMGAIKGAWMGSWGGADSVGAAGSAAARNPIGPHWPPLALLGALFGIFHQARSRRRLFWGTLLASGAGLLALLAWQLPVGWHAHRYLSAAWPLLLLAQLGGLAALLEAGALGRSAATALFCLWASFGIASWPWHLNRALEGGEAYAHANRTAALKLINLELGPVAGVDAGLLGYYGNRPFVDLLGITDHSLALASSQGKGAVLEALLAKGPLGLPRWCVLHDQRPDFDTQAWLNLGLLELVDKNWSEGMSLLRWNWNGAEQAKAPSRDWGSLRGSINVADLQDEKQRSFHAEGPFAKTTRLARLGLAPQAMQVPEGGRLLWVARFQAVPGAKALLLRASLIASGVFVLKQGGQTLTTKVSASRSDSYGEYALPLPEGASGEISVGLLQDGSQALLQEWALYRIWFLGP